MEILRIKIYLNNNTNKNCKNNSRTQGTTTITNWGVQGNEAYIYLQFDIKLISKKTKSIKNAYFSMLWLTLQWIGNLPRVYPSIEWQKMSE